MVFEALKFMLIGMGIVFLFLLLLVLAITLLAKIVAKYYPAKEPIEAIANSNSNSIDRKKVAAIAAAINRHINRK